MQTKPSMRQTIIEVITTQGSATSPELAQQLNLTRQAVDLTPLDQANEFFYCR